MISPRDQGSETTLYPSVALNFSTLAKAFMHVLGMANGCVLRILGAYPGRLMRRVGRAAQQALMRGNWHIADTTWLFSSNSHRYLV